MVQNVAYDGLDDCVAQVFKSFVVFLLLLWAIVIERSVYQRLTIDVNVVRVESEYFAQPTGKDFVLAIDNMVYIIGNRIDMHGNKG